MGNTAGSQLITAKPFYSDTSVLHQERNMKKLIFFSRASRPTRGRVTFQTHAHSLSDGAPSPFPPLI